MNTKPEKIKKEGASFAFKIAEYSKRGHENEVPLNKALRTVLNGSVSLVGKDFYTHVRENPDSPEARPFQDGALYHFYKTPHGDLVCLQYEEEKFKRSLHTGDDFWHQGDRFVVKTK